MISIADAAQQTPTLSDPEAAAEALGLTVPEGDASGLWLATVARAAGLGMPGDPLRPRAWIRFGRALKDDEEPEFGDVVVINTDAGETVGVLTSTDRGLFIWNGSGETIKHQKNRLLTTRRPIYPEKVE